MEAENLRNANIFFLYINIEDKIKINKRNQLVVQHMIFYDISK